MIDTAHHHKGNRCQHRYYRLDCEDFDALYEHARGRCQICGTPEAETRRQKLVIDHAPYYGLSAVRGLLCDKCNALMGRADEGHYEPLAFDYWRNSWFLRIVRARAKARKMGRRWAA